MLSIVQISLLARTIPQCVIHMSAQSTILQLFA